MGNLIEAARYAESRGGLRLEICSTGVVIRSAEGPYQMVSWEIIELAKFNVLKHVIDDVRQMAWGSRNNRLKD